MTWNEHTEVIVSGSDSPLRKAQLDKEEREHLEGVVSELRDLVEREIEYKLEHQYDLSEREGGDDLSEEEAVVRERLASAIDHENPGGKSWTWCYEQYVNGVGYTFINRIAALRCMEVRGFIDRPVTQIGESGLTPAAEEVLGKRFDVGPDEALIVAFEEATERFDDDIELLFDANSPYTVLNLDADLFKTSVEHLDKVSDSVWRADDVLGWVYEYYNVNLLDDLRRKADNEGLEPEDVPAANQFYTPHWIVRMLTDNSLGKLYLEHTSKLQDVVDNQERLSPDDRKNRSLSVNETPTISDFCTYLVPSEQEGEPTGFDHPQELSVIDPACGSGHFLLYAFDVLERIWRAETSLPSEEIPGLILQHNLYGVDLDMRACQLSAFNLYLKGRTRAEAEGAESFEMPEVGVVCADSSVADVEGVEAVFEEVAGDDPEIKEALRRILDAFEEVNGLGSLLDVRGTLGELFEDDSDLGGTQLTLSDNPHESHTLGQVLHSIREAVESHREGDSFLAQDLRSFIRLLDILAQDYDVALMNPPYGGGGKMPDIVQEYVGKNYKYKANYYVSFFEVCERISKDAGRIGMLIPRSFLYKGRFTKFRTDFVGSKGGFDFLAEFGLGVLDNATVRTVGSVVRKGDYPNPTGIFYRLYDLPTKKKEAGYINTISKFDTDVQREFTVDLKEFAKIPRTPICYSTPSEIRNLYSTNQFIDADQAGIQGKSIGNAVSGLVTGKDSRFIRKFWESQNQEEFQPLAYGGSDAWIAPKIQDVIEWGRDGSVMKRSSVSVRTPNDEFYGDSGLTWTRIKDTARRFGYYGGGLFETSSFMLFPEDDDILWNLLAALNSDLYNSLFLSQTPEKEWDADVLGCLPWVSELGQITDLEEAVKQQYSIVINQQTRDPTSPYYVRPSLHPGSGADFFYNHPHTKIIEQKIEPIANKNSSGDNIYKTSRLQKKRELRQRKQLEQLSQRIDQQVFDAVNLDQETREAALTEVFLRTSGGPEDREVPDPESVSDVPENIAQQVKELVHHFAMEAVRQETDGIIPIVGINGQADLLDRIVERFKSAYGDYAEDRLVEIDEILGTKSAAEEAYPNLRTFITEELFDYHLNRMESTPIMWKITTDRLVSDSIHEGFTCFLDYNSIDAGLFDRLTTQYLDPLKSELRDRQSAANQRRSNESLTTTERSEASDTFERTTNALTQIAEFESVMQELGSATEREFSTESREKLQTLASKVAAFRKETEDRLEAIDTLQKRKDEEWFQNTFSDGFWNKVQEWDDEWLDALTELEYACEAYASTEPVEAHLADLFNYFNWRLKGSDHYSSTGILFMTYYFEREGADLLNEDEEPSDHLTDNEQLLASLATGLDDPAILDESYIDNIWDPDDEHDEPPALAEYKALAEEIDERCQEIDKEIPSDWKDRALAEITTAGYRPNHKHGVAINITPLAEHAIVPKIVDDKVL